MSQLVSLFEQTLRLYVNPSATVQEVRIRPEGRQGYSGSVLRYYEVDYRDDKGQVATVPLVTKDAPLTERRVLALLSEQGQASVAYSYSLDLTTDRPPSRPAGGGQPALPPAVLDLNADTSMLVCQQYLGDGSPLATPTDTIAAKTARNLAALHYANLGQAAKLDWLPRANRDTIEPQVITNNWRPHWQYTLKIPEFAAQYGHYTDQLETAAARLLDFVDELEGEGNSLTLIHADLHTEHVLVHNDQPYLIDWGQARYGSLYLDLPNYFTPQQVLLYRDALAELGHDIPKGEFLERYHEAGRYVGFKYLSFVLWLWREAEPLHDASRLGLVKTALHGGYGLAYNGLD